MKAPPRRKARIAALQILYSRSQAGISHQGERLIGLEANLKEEGLAFARSLVTRAWADLNEVDRFIQEALQEWRQERLSSSLNALLRLAVSELLYWPETDAKVIFNEALDLCKSYVDPEATSLVNGLLHRVAVMKNRLPKT